MNYLIEDFDTCIENLRESYNDMKKTVDYMRNQLNSWNKDEEIQKYKAAAEDARHHSLLQLSDNEVKAIKDFRDKHYKKCAEPLHNKAAGNTYIYELTGTGLGTCIKITCPICGETKDITDTDNW